MSYCVMITHFPPPSTSPRQLIVITRINRNAKESSTISNLRYYLSSPIHSFAKLEDLQIVFPLINFKRTLLVLLSSDAAGRYGGRWQSILIETNRLHVPSFSAASTYPLPRIERAPHLSPGHSSDRSERTTIATRKSFWIVVNPSIRIPGDDDYHDQPRAAPVNAVTEEVWERRGDRHSTGRTFLDSQQGHSRPWLLIRLANITGVPVHCHSGQQQL